MKSYYLALLFLFANCTNAISQEIIKVQAMPKSHLIEKMIGEDPSIDPSCFDAKIKSNEAWNIHSKNLELWLDNKKYFTSMLKKYKYEKQSVTSLSNREWSKYYKIEIKIKGTDCTLEGKYRLTGDLENHFGKPGDIKHSIKVKLKKDSLGGIKKFKLFAPDSRGGEYEVLNALLLRTLGFISPRTSLIEFDIGGESLTAIFQEDITKELLEENGVHEGILIEGDESLSFSGFSPPRIVNDKILESDISKRISRHAIKKINYAYIKSFEFSETIRPELPKTLLFKDPHVSSDFFPNTSKDEIEKFNLMNFALYSNLGLALDDHRFVYDHISRRFRPIYYDGHTMYGWSNLKPLNFSFYEYNRQELLELIEQIDIDSFAKKASKLGIEKTKAEIKKFISKVSKNLTRLKVSSDYLDAKTNGYKISKNEFVKRYSEFLIDNAPLKNDYDMNELKYYWIKDKRNFMSCRNSNKTLFCLEKPLSSISPPIGSVVNFDDGIYLSGFDEYNEQYHNLIKYSFSDLGKTHIEVSPNIIPIVEPVKKTIDFKRINFEQKTAQIRIFNGELKGWTINIRKGLKLGYEAAHNDRRSMNGYTGCLTIDNIDIYQLSINIEDTNCEDAVHFVKVDGSVKSIKVKNSRADSIDADFSKLRFNKISVENAGNDCVDLSKGFYEIKNLDLKSCADKGISAGERAVLTGSVAKVSDSLIGLVSKDGASVAISKMNVKDSKICMMAYRKKEEFTGGKIFYDFVSCGGIPSYSQVGSIIDKRQISDSGSDYNEF